MRILIAGLLLFTMGGCVSFDERRLEEIKAIPPNGTAKCLGLGFNSRELGLFGEMTREYSKTESDLQKVYLGKFGISTNCPKPLRRVRVTIQDRGNVLLASTWGVISALTFGIIPYFHNSNLLITINDDDSGQLLDQFEHKSKKVMWIGYLPRMIKDNNIAQENTGIPEATQVEFNYILANRILRAVEN